MRNAWKFSLSAALALCLTGFPAVTAYAQQNIGYSFDGRVLQLKTERGDYVKLQDGNCDEGWDGCIVHRFRGTIANDQFYVVDIGYYEGGAINLYSHKSGTNTVIYGNPFMSPQKKLIATALGVEATGSENNGIYLFEIIDGEAKEIFRYRPEGYALYDFSHWTSENDAIINLTTACREYEDGKLTKNEMLTLPIKLARTDSGWQLDQGQGAACIESTKIR